MNQEEAFETQLAEQRAEKKETKPKKIKKKVKALEKILKNPLVQLIVPSLADLGTAGLFPGWTGIVVWTYISEKKAGKNPNIAEYLIVGIPAGTVDALEYLNLTGVLYILTIFLITIPCLLALWTWRIYKHVTGVKTTKPKKKK